MSPSLMIHGGAGAIPTPALYAPSLRRVIETGAELLERGGGALDVVALCVGLLEDDPLFNAGRGAALNAAGEPYCDASIMDGRTLAAGAVAGVRGVRNPVALARLVMEKTPHVLLIGAGAERFGRAQGIAFEADAYFVTPAQQADLAETQRRAEAGAPTPPGGKQGTVGAVARDRAGNLAAATSTGGLVNQMVGRVGDSPIVGAGVYADNASCAISCTGVGEDFLRTSLARTAALLVETQGLQAPEAAREAIAYLTRRVRGLGGLIMVDREGRCAAAHSTPDLLMAQWERGVIRVGGAA